MTEGNSFAKQSVFWKQTKRSKLLPSTLLQDDDDDDENIGNGAVISVKTATKVSNTNSKEKAKLLKEEGIFFAENNELNEAIMRWSKAISITPHDETLFEMQSQVFMLLEKDFQAAQQAEKATQIKKNWWIAWQTLGRAQMNLGHLKLAVRNFSRALHLNPWNHTLRTVDLAVAVERWNNLMKK